MVAVQLASALLAELPPVVVCHELAPALLAGFEAVAVAAAAADSAPQDDDAASASAEVAGAAAAALRAFVSNLQRQGGGGAEAVTAVCTFVCQAYEAQPGRAEWLVGGTAVVAAFGGDEAAQPLLVELLHRLVSAGCAQLQAAGGLDGAPPLAIGLFELLIAAGDATPAGLAASGALSTGLAMCAQLAATLNHSSH